MDKEEEERLGQNVRKGRHLTLIEPLVILDGMLYESYLDRRSRLVTNKVTHMPVCFGYLSPEYRHADFYGDYLVEIVTMDGLSDLISKKIKWLNSIERTIVSNISRKES